MSQHVASSCSQPCVAHCDKHHADHRGHWSGVEPGWSLATPDQSPIETTQRPAQTAAAAAAARQLSAAGTQRRHIDDELQRQRTCRRSTSTSYCHQSTTTQWHYHSWRSSANCLQASSHQLQVRPVQLQHRRRRVCSDPSRQDVATGSAGGRRCRSATTDDCAAGRSIDHSKHTGRRRHRRPTLLSTHNPPQNSHIPIRTQAVSTTIDPQHSHTAHINIKYISVHIQRSERIHNFSLHTRIETVSNY